MFEGFTITDVKKVFGYANNNKALFKDYWKIIKDKQYLGIKDLGKVQDVDKFYTKAFSYIDDNKLRAQLFTLQGDLYKNYGYFLHSDSVINFSGLMTIFWYIDICMRELVQITKQGSNVEIYSKQDEYYFETCLSLYANQLYLSRLIMINDEPYYSVMNLIALNFYGALALQYSKVFKEEGIVLFPVTRKMLNSDLVEDLIYHSEDILPDSRNIRYTDLYNANRIRTRITQHCFV